MQKNDNINAINYSPGRTNEELDLERLKKNMQLSDTEKFYKLTSLMKQSIMLKKMGQK